MKGRVEMNSDEKTKYDRPSFSFDSDRDIPNLIFMFGVIAVIAQVYIGWDDFSNVWSYMGINSQQALFEWQDATGCKQQLKSVALNGLKV